MTNTKEMRLEDLAGKFNLKEAQQFISQMPYDYETIDAEGKYMIRSPKKALERGAVMCIDGALLLAALTGLDPKIMCMYFKTKNHAVLMTQNQETKLYGALGKSRYPDLEARSPIYPTETELARSYLGPLFYDVVDVNLQVKDWQTTDKDISQLIIHPISKRI